MINDYVIELKNFPTNPFSENYVHTDKEYELVPVKFLSVQVIDSLKSLNLYTNKFSVFHSEGYKEHGIHRDNSIYDDMAKLIWMWGDDHEMLWYKTNDTAKAVPGSNTGPESISSSYLAYAKEDVQIIHRQKINGPALVQVGPPHSVINYSGSRMSCTLVPCITKNGIPNTPLTFSEAVKLFSDFLP